MEVWGSIRAKVEVDPAEVIEKLFLNEICADHGYVTTEGGKFHLVTNHLRGHGEIEEVEEITEERYIYIQALLDVMTHLSTKGK